MRDRRNNLQNYTDQQYIKQQLKAIKQAKKDGRDREAQRIADDLFEWLGWNDDGF